MDQQSSGTDQFADFASHIPASLSAEAKWIALADYLEKWFYRPDLEALRCSMAACRAHHVNADPVWLFVIGPSGSGKTSVVINCCSALPKTYVESNLTTNSLLSGAVNGASHGLLEQIGSGILLFKDFTTILSKRDEDLKMIMAQFREVYDGGYKHRTGQRTPDWAGKITIIAAVTHAIEQAWSVHRHMGERFMQLRWANTDSLEIARAARKQRGFEKTIAREMRLLAKDFFQTDYPTPSVSEEQGSIIDRISTAVATLRSPVRRTAKNEILEAYLSEEPTRIAKAMENSVVHHAALFQRDVSDEDFALVHRLAHDNIPRHRLAILNNVPDVGIDSSDLLSLSKLTEAQYKYYLDDLVFLGVLGIRHNGLTREIHVTEKFHPLWFID